MVNIRTPYNNPPAPVEVGPFKDGRTKQTEKAASDINRIVAQYDRTGMLPMNMRQGVYLDVSQVGNYQEAVARVEMAEKAFVALPANVRKRFDNSPAVFLDFVSKEENVDEMREMGLLPKLKAPEAPVPPS